MTLLHYVSYAAALVAFGFVTLSLASGLLYISELIEEHSRLAKVIGQRGIYVIILLHTALYFTDGLPLHLTAFSILCHIVYLQNFSNTWPIISLTSISFMSSCILVMADHFLWFFYFSKLTQTARHTAYRGGGYGKRNEVPGFASIATFFGLCVWLAPLFLFLSLSANDNALPISGTAVEPSSPTDPKISVHATRSHGHSRSRSSLFKSLFDVLPRVRPLSSRKEPEGIIAPRSPRASNLVIPSSPTRAPNTLSRSPSPGFVATTRQDSGDRLFSQGSPSTLNPPPRRSPGRESGLGLRKVSSTGRLDEQ